MYILTYVRILFSKQHSDVDENKKKAKKKGRFCKKKSQCVAKHSEVVPSEKVSIELIWVNWQFLLYALLVFILQLN